MEIQLWNGTNILHRLDKGLVLRTNPGLRQAIKDEDPDMLEALFAELSAYAMFVSTMVDNRDDLDVTDGFDQSLDSVIERFSQMAYTTRSAAQFFEATRGEREPERETALLTQTHRLTNVLDQIQQPLRQLKLESVTEG